MRGDATHKGPARNDPGGGMAWTPVATSAKAQDQTLFWLTPAPQSPFLAWLPKQSPTALSPMNSRAATRRLRSKETGQLKENRVLNGPSGKPAPNAFESGWTSRVWIASAAIDQAYLGRHGSRDARRTPTVACSDGPAIVLFCVFADTTYTEVEAEYDEAIRRVWLIVTGYDILDRFSRWYQPVGNSACLRADDFSDGSRTRADRNDGNVRDLSEDENFDGRPHIVKEDEGDEDEGMAVRDMPSLIWVLTLGIGLATGVSGVL